jgi:UDP-glucose 4-epimerase
LTLLPALRDRAASISLSQSSTCATCGLSDKIPLDEDVNTNPNLSFLALKLMVGRMPADFQYRFGIPHD